MSVLTVAAQVMQAIQEGEMPDRMNMYAPPETTSAHQGEEPTATFPAGWTAIESNIKCRFVSTANEGSESENEELTQSLMKGEIVKPLSSARPKPEYRIRYTFADTTVVDFELLPEQRASFSSAIHIGVMKVS